MPCPLRGEADPRRRMADRWSCIRGRAARKMAAMPSDVDDDNTNASTLAMASGASDSFDDVLMRLVRTRDAEIDVALAAGFEIAGRFRIVRLLGVGGMGTVYLARDQSLDREVAIKVHHQSGGAERLRREAVAMARLAHPHVITVFEVGELGRRPFVVMEYIAGTTLRAWLAEAPRGVGEILANAVAAGEGLAAAHAAGLVHRDFKPENMMIGSDGRVRVGDFGLARELDAQDPAATSGRDERAGRAAAGGERASSSGSTPMRAVTQTGAVLGTPAYMAPEQFAGVPVDARADQFAYCVTVWEALCGQRPFAGTTFDHLKAAITGGVRTPPATPPEVSAQVRAALERGLSTDPRARFASMQALLAELRPRVRRRRWLTAAAAGVAIAGAAIAWSGRGETAREMCGHARALTQGAWDPARRVAVAQAFVRSGRPNADATFARVAERLDRGIDELSAARIDACEATHVRGEQSPLLLDRRVRCLDRKLGELGAVVGVLAAGQASVVDHAVEAVAALGPIAECADRAALSQAVALPAEPLARTRVAGLDRRLAEILAHRAAGQYDATLPLAEALDRDAAAIDYAPVRARIAAAHAMLLQDLKRGAPAEAAWFAAVQLASAARDERLVFDAWRALLEVRVGMTSLVGTDVLVEAATATAARLERDDPRHALLDQSLGGLHVLDGKFADAVRHATAACDWFAGHAPGTLEEAEAQRMLSVARAERGDHAGALINNFRALAILTQLLGADHPQVARLHQARSILLTALSRFDDALVELTGVIGPIERAYGTQSVPRGELAFAIGEIERKHANYAAATAAYEQAVAIFRSAGNDLETARALLGLGVVELALGHNETARSQDERAMAAAERALPTSERLLAVILQMHSATLQGAERALAERELVRALEITTRIYGPSAVKVGQIENSLGTHFLDFETQDQAVAHLRRALEIEEPVLGAEAYDVVVAHHNLGTALFNQDHFGEALAQHERALAGLEHLLGPDHPTLVAPLCILAYEYAELGRAGDGLAAARRARVILAKAHQPSNPDLDLGYGHALWVSGGDRPRAVALVRAAAVQLRATHDDEFMLRRAEAWLRTHH